MGVLNCCKLIILRSYAWGYSLLVGLLSGFNRSCPRLIPQKVMEFIENMCYDRAYIADLAAAARRIAKKELFLRIETPGPRVRNQNEETNDDSYILFTPPHHPDLWQHISPPRG
jgi:hypothetical protein